MGAEGEWGRSEKAVKGNGRSVLRISSHVQGLRGSS